MQSFFFFNSLSLYLFLYFIYCQFLPSFLFLFSKLIFPWSCLFQFIFHSVFASLPFTFSSPLSFSPNLCLSFSSHFASSLLTRVAGGMSRSNVQIVLESIHGFTASEWHSYHRHHNKVLSTFFISPRKSKKTFEVLCEAKWQLCSTMSLYPNTDWS